MGARLHSHVQLQLLRLFSLVPTFEVTTFVCVSCCKTHAKSLRVKMAERVQTMVRITIVIVPMEYSACVVNVRMLWKPFLNLNLIVVYVSVYTLSVYISMTHLAP